MNTQSIASFTRRLAALVGFVATTLFAQTADDTASQEPVTLAPFTVVSSADSGYRMGSATVASRSNKSLLDIPQTVNVLTAEFLRDTFAFTQDDAIKFVSNTAVRNASVAGIDPGMYIMRGFENRNAYVEGVLMPAYRRDMAGYDRMEVIKGVPSAVLGRADASGAINFVLKKPVANRQFTDVKAVIGSDNLYRVEADINQPLSDELSARVVVIAEDSDVFVREPNDQRFYRVYPSLRFTPSAKTEVIFNGEFLRTNSMIAAYGHGFTIMPAKFRRLFPATIGSATDPITALDLPWDFYLSPSELTDEVASAMVTFTHRFSDNIDFRQIVNYVSMEQREEFYSAGGNLPDANPFDPTNARGLYKSLLYDKNARWESRWNAVGDLLFRYGWENLPLTPKLSTMIGYSLMSRESSYASRRYPILGEARFLNLSNPQFSPVGENAPLDRNNVGNLANNTSQEQTYSYYIQQELTLWQDRISLVYGWRDTTSNGTFTNYLNPASPRNDTDSHPPASVRFGGSIRLRENLSLYASRSEQKDPAQTTLVWSRLNAGDPRARETIVGNPSTESTEVGFKANLLSNRIYLSLAYFELGRTGTVDNEGINVESPPGSGQTVLAQRRFLTDGDTSEGWEIEVIGEVTSRLTVLATGSIIDTAQPDPTTATVGDTRAVRFVPDWGANLFLKYAFHDAGRDGLSIRAGTNIIGPVPQSEVSNFGRQPIDKIQKRVDLGASYTWGNKRHRVDVQVGNVFNETFFVVRVNNPRDYRLSYSVRF